jgi:hypothetical protein
MDQHLGNELIFHGFIVLTSLACTVAICRTQLREIDRRLGVVEKHYVPRRELELRLQNIETWSRRSYRMLRTRMRLTATEEEKVNR